MVIVVVLVQGGGFFFNFLIETVFFIVHSNVCVSQRQEIIEVLARVFLRYQFLGVVGYIRFGF